MSDEKNIFDENNSTVKPHDFEKKKKPFSLFLAIHTEPCLLHIQVFEKSKIIFYA